ncbi:MAG: lipocalin-like domain-containing protein [Marivita sp.]|uniref:lipocalin-like domain-containing protein n=1 Tax=Marivita sp. TaxID=2003365 RepID=UPI003EF7E2CE
MSVRIAALLTLLPMLAAAQGFAGLGTTADGFATPQRGTTLTFPADHAAHPDFRIEWWYLTSNLSAADGTEYGLQWTLFRSALAPEAGEGFDTPQLWMGHAAVTTPEDHYVAERFARGGVGQAGVETDPFVAWIDEWQLSGLTGPGVLRATGDDFSYDMRLSAQGPLVLHGDEGYSVKSAEGQASYYYSQPFFDIAGTLSLPEGDLAVNGSAWLDREWSSQPLSESQTGWDWFSLVFESGERMMGFLLRQEDGTAYTSATWIDPQGRATALPPGAFQAEPLSETEVANRSVPTRWAVRLPDHDVDITVEALNPQAWMATSVPYWEGPVTVDGSHSGRGYLEMTGY